MKKIAFARQLVKRLTTPFQQPTIPTSNDHTDGTWVDTDLYSGEMCLNTASRELTMRVSGTGGDTIDYIQKTTSFNVLSGIAAKFQTYSQITQTNDATPTTVGAFNFSTYKSLVGKVKVYGYRDAGENKAFYQEGIVNYDITNDVVVEDWGQELENLGGALPCTIDAATGVLGVEVTGVAAIDINWFVEYDLTLFL